MASVTARGAAAYENGPTSRFFYLRRGDIDLSQPLSIFYTVGGKARQGLDYGPIGTGVTIKPGQWLRRIEVAPVDDRLVENNESVTLTLIGGAGYTIDPDRTSATIRIISSEDTPQPTRITWSARAASPILRAEALRAVIDQRIFVLGGFSGADGPVRRSDVYDPLTDQWRRIADLPTRLTHAGVATDGRDIYVVGGYVGIGASGYRQQFGTRDAWRYNVNSNQWTALPPLPVALAGGGSAVVGGMLHYFGGNDAARNDTGVNLALDLGDPASGWKSRAPLPTPRSHFATATVNGGIFVLGGQRNNDDALTTLNDAHAYDPVSDAWTRLAGLPHAVSHIASASATLHGRIYVAGGETDHEVATERVIAYDVAADAWHELTPLPGKRFSGVLGIIGGALFFTTGSSQTTTWKGLLS